MFSNNFVVSILHNNQVISEDKSGTALLPFNSEYSVRLRNKDKRRAVASLFIDDELQGNFVVNPGIHIDIERSSKKTTKFKFVSPNTFAAAVAGKSQNIEGRNGVVRVEWKLEKASASPPPAPIFQPMTKGISREGEKGLYRSAGSGPCGQSTPSSDYGGGKEEKTSGGILRSLGFCDTPQNAGSEGCTVDGSYSRQQFYTVNVDLEDSAPVVIQLVLKGYFPEQPIVKGINYCGDCGNRINLDSNYCSSCGGKLQR